MAGETANLRETLAEPEVGQFERDVYALEAAGFAIIPEFIDAAMIDRLLASYREYEAEVDAFVSAGGELVNPTGWPIKSARAAYAVSTDVQDLIMDRRIQAYARAYLGDPLLRDCQFLTNMPDARNAARGLDGKVSYHRDKFWKDESIKQDFLWCFILLTDMTPENGGTILAYPVITHTHYM